MTNHQKGIEFEKECYQKLESLGFKDLSFTKNTDNGADIIGTFNKTKYVFQCKNHSKAQGNRCVQEVVSAQKLYKANRSAVISKSGFTRAAKSLAKANNCILISAIDLFDLESFPPTNYSAIFQDSSTYIDIDYDVLEKYEEKKRYYGRTPKWEEMDKHFRYLIIQKYKNYGNFLATIGDRKYTCKPTDEELKAEYLRIRSIIKKTPTLEDIKKNSNIPLNSFRAYPLSKLQRECGDRPNIERGVTKEELKKAYCELLELLHRPPSGKEIDSLGKYRKSYYVKRWGSFNSFLSEIGMLEVQPKSKAYSKKEIVIIYSLIKNLLSITRSNSDFIVNHTTLEKLYFDDKRIISPTTISHKFGSWTQFKEYYERIDNKEILEWIESVYKK